MKTSFDCLASLVLFIAIQFGPVLEFVFAQDEPANRVRFFDDFEDGSVDPETWKMLDPATWRCDTGAGNATLRISNRESDYKPVVRSPYHVALIRNVKVGDFELTFRVRNLEDTGPHRDCCVFFAYQDDQHFYYVHLGAKPDDASGQIMIVNEAPRTPLTKNTRATGWTDGWHQVKVVRKVQSGTIEVYFDDMSRPHMSIVDTTFKFGVVGIGSFDDMNEFDDLKLTGVSPSDPRNGAFQRR